jgi:ergothioneine biosynthesis protein EgtB
VLEREQAAAWYRRNRGRSQAIFDLLTEDAYYARPIALRHPIVFYEGHLPAFSLNTLVKRALGKPGFDPTLELLFARGIDPDEEGVTAGTAVRHQASGGVNRRDWPTRDEVLAFAAEADCRVLEAIAQMEPGQAAAVSTILEHEAMHHETLLYMWHRLSFEQKRRPDYYAPRVTGCAPREDWVEVPGGRVALGLEPGADVFGWDNEFPRQHVSVPPFLIERYDVTNQRFMEFVDAGGYANPRWWSREDWAWIESERVSHPLFWEMVDGAWWWRGMFDRFPLPAAWPVYVSHAEAAAFARWRGARLPTEAEFHCAAYGAGDEVPLHPWGSDAPRRRHGVFDFSSWDPEPVGSHPDGRSPCGAEDLVGNGWEWTSSLFAPFPGFQPMPLYPEYSADYFDGEHFVLKGGSSATAAELLRPSFRNWFRPRYPYVYATFRCVAAARRG